MKDAKAIELITLLGNPDREHRNNRHNLPWLLADQLVTDNSCWTEKFKGICSPYSFSGKRLFLLKPHTYMNSSGESVQKALHFYKYAPENLLVIHDELELPFGVSELRFGGGLGGHNGLRSVKQQLGTPDFWRLRLGIGRPARGSVHSFVLSDFNPEERSQLTDYLRGVAGTLQNFLREEHPASFKKKTRHLAEN